MADFKQAHAITVVSEGGYTDNPDDNGNWTGGKKGYGNLIGTNHGIAAFVLKAYLKRMPTVADMKNLTKETAELIYKLNYWNPLRGDEIQNQGKANILYDSAVNYGVSVAIKMAQRLLELPETGRMNNQTIDKINNK